MQFQVFNMFARLFDDLQGLSMGRRLFLQFRFNAIELCNNIREFPFAVVAVVLKFFQFARVDVFDILFKLFAKLGVLVVDLIKLPCHLATVVFHRFDLLTKLFILVAETLHDKLKLGDLKSIEIVRHKL